MKTEIYMRITERLIKGKIFQEYDNPEDNEYEWWMDITDCVQMIFGDIVQEAKIMISPYATEHEIYRDVNEEYDSIYENALELKKIELDDCPIQITFINGKSIEFECTEYGDIRLII